MSAVEPLLEVSPLLTHDREASLRLRLARDAQRAWAARPLPERCARLSGVADVLLQRADAFAALIHDENGKPLVEAYGHEIGPCAATVRYLCSEAPRILAGRSFAPAAMPLRQVTVSREPHGVVLVISPWNIPLSIPFGQVLAALIAGNAVILKPSEVTPRIGAALGDLFAACDLPPNLLQVVQGDGRVGAELIAERPDKVFFTGSLRTGRKVMAAAAAHPIPVSLELGGVDALVVCEDADVELASSAIAFGGTFNHGQVCASVERVLVHEALADVVVARVADKLRSVDPQSLGRVTNPVQCQVYDRHLADARQRGVAFACGGSWRDAERLEPTVLHGPGIEESLVWREETFGPVIAVAKFRSDDEAVRMANSGEFGLTASVFAGSPERADRIAARLRVGAVSINEVAATLHAYGDVPWGGVDGSGFGRSHGPEGLLACTRTKVVDRPRPGVPSFKPPWWFPYDPEQRAMMADFAQVLGQRGATGRLAALGRMSRGFLRQLARHPRL